MEGWSLNVTSLNSSLGFGFIQKRGGVGGKPENDIFRAGWLAHGDSVVFKETSSLTPLILQASREAVPSS